MLQKITPFLWFANQAEEAANHYVSIFRNSRILTTSRYGEAGFEIHGMPAGSVMVVEFELDGQRFSALNGGLEFKFNESVSFLVGCDNQEELDYYWNALSAGGDPRSQQCGWLRDKFGLSWQVVPILVLEMLRHSDHNKSQAAMQAVMGMKKLDIEPIRHAFDLAGQR